MKTFKCRWKKDNKEFVGTWNVENRVELEADLKKMDGELIEILEEGKNVNVDSISSPKIYKGLRVSRLNEDDNTHPHREERQAPLFDFSNKRTHRWSRLNSFFGFIIFFIIVVVIAYFYLKTNSNIYSKDSSTQNNNLNNDMPFHGKVTSQSTISNSIVTNSNDLSNAYTLNVPNSQGGYIPIIITKSGDGYTGPKGEYYAEFPSISQLQSVYGLGTPNSTDVANTNVEPRISTETSTESSTDNFDNTISEANDAKDYPKSETPLILCLNRAYQDEGDGPKEGYLYNLGALEATQKLPNGYIISPISGYADDTDVAFLYTDRQFDQDQLLGDPGGSFLLWAYYVGTYTYTTATGFNKTIYAFKLYEG